MAEPILSLEEYISRLPTRVNIRKGAYPLLYNYRGRWSTPDAIRRRLKADRAAQKRTGHRSRNALRDQALDMLGGKCVHCGYKRDRRALQFDHIHGGGYKDAIKRSKTPATYYRHIMEVGSAKFQILCANCNVIKRAENHEHRRPIIQDE